MDGRTDTTQSEPVSCLEAVAVFTSMMELSQILGLDGRGVAFLEVCSYIPAPSTLRSMQQSVRDGLSQVAFLAILPPK